MRSRESQETIAIRIFTTAGLRFISANSLRKSRDNSNDRLQDLDFEYASKLEKVKRQ